MAAAAPTVRTALLACALSFPGATDLPAQEPDSPRTTWETLPPTDLVPSAASWALSRAGDGEVTRSYDDLQNTTEILVRLVPDSESPGENPTVLYFSAVFRGRTLRVTPDRVWMRAQSNLSVQPMRIRAPSLSLTAGGASIVHVVDPPHGAAAWLNYPCVHGEGPCTFDGVVAAIPVVSFFRLVESTRAFGEALGFPFSLSRAHIQPLAEMARQLVPGQ